MTFTGSNQSGYDFVYTVVAGDVWLERGSVVEVEGAAIDVDGDGYLTPVRTYEVDGPYLDITVAPSIDHCCYDF